LRPAWNPVKQPLKRRCRARVRCWCPRAATSGAHTSGKAEPDSSWVQDPGSNHGVMRTMPWTTSPPPKQAASAATGFGR
jgi:hypothetical protein